MEFKSTDRCKSDTGSKGCLVHGFCRFMLISEFGLQTQLNNYVSTCFLLLSVLLYHTNYLAIALSLYSNQAFWVFLMSLYPIPLRETLYLCLSKNEAFHLLRGIKC